MKKAIVLLSGGQDSTTCLYWAKRHFQEVRAIGFYYAQKHSVELLQAEKIANEAEVPFKVIDVKGLLSGSSLTDHSQDSNSKHRINKDLPASFTAGRNALFLTLAASYAHALEIPNIITGVCETDFSGYPDCRAEFIKSQEKTLQLALDSPELTIFTPLMYLTKAQTWQLAAQLGIVEIVRTMTLTDYNGDSTMNEWGMGKEDNPASILRAKGYFEAKEKGWI